MALDYRDFQFWARKARIEGLRKQIQAVVVAAIGNGGRESVKRYITDLQDEINLIEPPMYDPQACRQTWRDNLAALARRKK